MSPSLPVTGVLADGGLDTARMAFFDLRSAVDIFLSLPPAGIVNS